MNSINVESFLKTKNITILLFSNVFVNIDEVNLFYIRFDAISILCIKTLARKSAIGSSDFTSSVALFRNFVNSHSICGFLKQYLHMARAMCFYHIFWFFPSKRGK